MKLSILLSTLMITSGLALEPALANEAHHPDQQSAAAKPTGLSADQTIKKMQMNTKIMQSQLEQMAKSKDPNQRMKLMQDHQKTMQENMMASKGMMMGAMTDCPMMKGGMMGGGMGMMGGGMMGQGMQGNMAGQDDMMAKRMEMMAKRMEMMEKRMEMMQMMMQTNMGNRQGSPESPAK